MKHLLQKIFCLLMCTTPLFPASYQWGSLTGNDAWDGATSGGLIEEGSASLGFEEIAISYDGTTTTTQFGLFKPTAADDLAILDTVKIKGEVEIRFEGDGNATNKEYFFIDVGDSAAPTTPTKIQAFTDASSDVNSCANLIFNVAQNKSIIINVQSDLLFQSGDAVGVGDAVPFYLTFRGQGTTIFRLPSGRTISFAPQVEGKEGDPGLSDEGVHVRVLMDQSSFDVYGDIDNGIAPRSQVVFEKWSHGTDAHGDSVNVDTWDDCWVKIGQLSSFAFVSANYNGIGEKWLDIDNDDGIDVGEPIARPGYGSVAFDPSNDAEGRMILDIARGQKVTGNDFTDGAMNVYGMYVNPILPGSDRKQPVVLNSDIRDYVYFNQRAGVRAVFRVIDDVAYAEQIDTSTPELAASTKAAWRARTEDTRRGLVIMNHNNSLPKLASNIQLSARIDLNQWALSNTYQPGFIVGINGELECYANTFLDYYANNVGKKFESSIHTPGSAAHTDDVIKKRNPAALFVDGLFNKYERPTLHAKDVFGANPVSDLLYIGSRDDYGVHARVSLYGNSGIYVRAIAPYDVNSTVLPDPEFLQSKSAALYYLPDNHNDGTFVNTATLGIGQYNGSLVEVLDDFGDPVMQSTTPEGEHAMCIEGPVTVSTWEGQQGQAAAGFLKVPSIKINHAGQEVYFTDYAEHLEGTVVTPTEAVLTQRPMPLNKYCAVYNASSILINDKVVLDGINWIHDDVTRDQHIPAMLPEPGALSRPHIVGGEIEDLRGNLQPPRIHLNNATLSCHESLVATGVAFTVNELPTSKAKGTTVIDSHNVSRIVFYNRGREYDSNGYGRVLQLGSQGNLAADGINTSPMFADAFIDVYRAAPTNGGSALAKSAIRLELQTANEPTATPAEQALHMIYLANDSQVVLGWPTEEGDSGYAPSDFDSTILASLQKSDPLNAKGFRFSTHETGSGHLEINGGPFFFGAGDGVLGLPPEQPISGIDVGGVLYVNHGGKFSITNTNDIFIDTVFARRIGTSDSGSGVMALPRDQAHFLPSGVIQQYNVDFTEDKITEGRWAGYVALPVNNNVHLIDVNRLFPGDGFGVK